MISILFPITRGGIDFWTCFVGCNGKVLRSVRWFKNRNRSTRQQGKVFSAPTEFFSRKLFCPAFMQQQVCESREEANHLQSFVRWRDAMIFNLLSFSFYALFACSPFVAWEYYRMIFNWGMWMSCRIWTSYVLSNVIQRPYDFFKR